MASGGAGGGPWGVPGGFWGAVGGGGAPPDSSKVQEAKLEVSMGEPSSWLLTAVNASESSARSGDRDAEGKGH